MAHGSVVPQLSQANTKVFVNCPFDHSYWEFLVAIKFTIIFCGCKPICARERHDAGETRIEKICDLINQCALGIHDISNVSLDKHKQKGYRLPRFNMPFEYGLFMGANYFGNGQHEQKVCLVFEDQPFRSKIYLSDTAGQDHCAHNGDIKELINHTRNFLVEKLKKGEIFPHGYKVYANYTKCRNDWMPLITKELMDCEFAELQKSTNNDLLSVIEKSIEAMIKETKKKEEDQN